MNEQINLLDEIYMDGFCGGGGWSTGFEFAVGKPVDIGINHDKSAIDMHRKNHPYTKHYNESIYEVDPYKAVAGRPVGWAHFSPDCTHFSVAKGGKPVKKSIRGLAWVITKWAGTVKPRIISMENVKEFMTWGPLVAKRGENGRVIKLDGTEAIKGEKVPLQEQQLIPDKKRAGKTFKRFIQVMQDLGYVAEWRILTACDYGTPTSRRRLFIIFRRDGKPIIWPKPTHGNPDSEEVKSGKLLPYRTAADCIEWDRPIQSIFDRKKPLAENTLKRIARGIKKFIVDNDSPFIIQVNHSGDNFRGQSIDAPLPTTTGKNGFGVVAPCIMCNNDNNVGSSVEEPLHTITTANRHFLTAPVMTSIGHTSTKDRSRGVDEPIRTTTSKNEHCLVSANLIQYHSETTKNEVRGQKITDPIQTIDTANRHGLSMAFMEKTDHNKMIMPFMSEYYSGEGVKGSAADSPLPTITTKDRFSCVAPVMIQTGYGERKGQQPRALDLKKPLGTVVSTSKHAIAAAFINRQFGTSIGSKCDAPLGAVTQIDKSHLVEVFLQRHDINPDIVINGEHYRIVDICMRMLAPRELYNANGFPPDYEIEFDIDGRPYPKSQQVAKCGNSVPPPFATALVRANMPEVCVWDIDTLGKLNNRIAI